MSDEPVVTPETPPVAAPEAIPEPVLAPEPTLAPETPPVAAEAPPPAPEPPQPPAQLTDEQSKQLEADIERLWRILESILGKLNALQTQSKGRASLSSISIQEALGLFSALAGLIRAHDTAHYHVEQGLLTDFLRLQDRHNSTTFLANVIVEALIGKGILTGAEDLQGFGALYSHKLKLMQEQRNKVEGEKVLAAAVEAGKRAMEEAVPEATPDAVASAEVTESTLEPDGKIVQFPGK